MHRILIVLLGALLLAPGAAPAQSNFTRTNAAGPHAVGLRVVEQHDRSRGYRGATDLYTGKPTPGERSRPIQTLVWYPAVDGTGRPLRAGDYLRLGGTSEEFPAIVTERTRLEDRHVDRWIGALAPDRAEAELAAPMLARRDAEPGPGKHPVVIYAPSYRATAFENADLCEYLASHGYVVIASPSIGQTPAGMTDDLEGVEAQLGDIQFLVGYAHTVPQADTDRLAVAGYSWGGLANVMAAARDARIDALVSLDGSVRSYPDVIEQSRFLTPERITVPMLYVAATPRQIEDLPPDMNAERSFLNKMRYADLHRVTLAPYVHANFSVMGQRFMPEGSYGNYDKDELSVANSWLETYVLRFLDAHLRDDAAGRAFLDLPANQTGAPAHLLTLYKRESSGAPPTRAAFAAQLAREGFDQAPAIYQEWRTREPGFALPDAELTSWGYVLMRAGESNASIAIFRLNTELHADSWNAFDSLGEAYADAGDKALAIAAYRKSLDLNPGNGNAAVRLARLGAKP